MDEQLRQLERHLRELLAEHDGMLELIRRKRQALRTARPAEVDRCTRAENRHVQRIGQIEKERQRVVAALTQSIAPQAQRPLRLGQIADAVGEPTRGRLLTLRQMIHQRIDEVRHESRVTRTAMEGLLNHVQGMVQSIVQHVGGGGTYERRGRVATASATVSSFHTTG